MKQSHASNSHEPMIMILGVIGVLCALFFFLQRFNVIQTVFEVSDTAYIYFFAAFTLLAGIILLFKTLGFLGN